MPRFSRTGVERRGGKGHKLRNAKMIGELQIDAGQVPSHSHYCAPLLSYCIIATGPTRLLPPQAPILPPTRHSPCRWPSGVVVSVLRVAQSKNTFDGDNQEEQEPSKLE